MKDFSASKFKLSHKIAFVCKDVLDGVEIVSGASILVSECTFRRHVVFGPPGDALLASKLDDFARSNWWSFFSCCRSFGRSVFALSVSELPVFGRSGR